MKELSCHIKIGKYVFHYVVDLIIKTDIRELTDTCTLNLPRKLEWEGKNIAFGDNNLLKPGGYEVTIKIGYDNDIKQVFNGYLKRIKSGVRVGLICENEMYNLKQNNFTLSYKKVSLKKLLNDICDGLNYQAVDIELGQLRITNMSTAQILAHLKKEYGIYTYFRNGILYSGLAYWPSIAKEHIFRFQKNVARDGHPDFMKAEDVKLKVKAISIMPDNSKISINIGNKEGEQRTLYFYNVKKEALESLAEKQLKKLKYTGFRGKLTAFGEPLAQKGDIANIVDDITPERNGKYLIQAVEYKFGKGYKQIIELGAKV